MTILESIVVFVIICALPVFALLVYLFRRLPRLTWRRLLAVLMITIVLAAAIATLHMIVIPAIFNPPRISPNCYVANGLSRPKSYHCYASTSPISATVKWITADGKIYSGAQVDLTGKPHEKVRVELIAKDHRQLTHTEVTLP